MKKEQALASAKAHLQNEYKFFEYLVKFCTLNPKDDNWRLWEDDDGNYLNIIDNQVYPSKKEYINTKDIYRRSRPKQIANISRWVLIDADTLYFLDKDDKLRVCLFKDRKWKKNKLPLLVDGNILKLIIKYKNKKFKQIKRQKYDWLFAGEVKDKQIMAFLKEYGV